MTLVLDELLRSQLLSLIVENSTKIEMMAQADSGGISIEPMPANM